MRTVIAVAVVLVAGMSVAGEPIVIGESGFENHAVDTWLSTTDWWMRRGDVQIADGLGFDKYVNGTTATLDYTQAVKSFNNSIPPRAIVTFTTRFYARYGQAATYIGMGDTQGPSEMGIFLENTGNMLRMAVHERMGSGQSEDMWDGYDTPTWWSKVTDVEITVDTANNETWCVLSGSGEVRTSSKMSIDEGSESILKTIFIMWAGVTAYDAVRVDDVSIVAVDAPGAATVVLVGIGLLGLVIRRRRV